MHLYFANTISVWRYDEFKAQLCHQNPKWKKPQKGEHNVV